MDLDEKILKWGIKGGMCAIFLLPLIFVSIFFFPFIVPKNLLFRVIVEVSFLLYIILAFKYPRYRPKLIFLNLAVVGYFLILVVTSLTGLNFARSFWGNYERMDGLLNIFHLVLFFILLTSVLKERKEWYQLFSFSLGSSLIMSIFSVGQKLGFVFLSQASGARLSGTIGNAAFFAAYLIFHFFWLIFFLLNSKRFQVKPFLVSFFSLEVLFFLSLVLKAGRRAEVFSQIFSDQKFLVFFLVFNALMILLWLYRKNSKAVFSFLLFFSFLTSFVLFNTGTRGALLGLSVSLFILLIFFAVKGKHWERLLALLILIAIIVSGITIFLNRESDWVKNEPNLQKIAVTSFKDITVESRLLTWQSSWQAVTEDPFRFIFGYGLENFSALFDRYFNPRIFKDAGSRVWFDRAHNLIFDLWTTSGIIGLLAFLSVLGGALVCLIRSFLKNQSKNRDIFFIFSVLLIAYFVQNLFVFDTLNTYVLLFLSLGFISFIFSEEFPAKFKLGERKERNLDIFNVAILVGILLLVVWIFNGRVALANTWLVKGSLGDRMGMTDQERFKYLEKSISSGFLGRFEATEQLSAFARGLIGNEKVPIEFSYDVALKTIEEFEKNIEMDPFNIRYYLYLANFYLDILPAFNSQYPQPTSQWLDKVIELTEKAKPLSPTRPQLYFVKSRAYVFQGELDEAFAVFREGVELAPWVKQVHFDLAILYIFGGRDDLAQEKLDFIEEEWLITENDYLRLVNVYVVKKNYNKVAEIYIKLTELDPNNISYYTKAAGAFAQAGDNKSAREWALKVLEVDPNTNPQINQFLEDLEKGKFLE